MTLPCLRLFSDDLHDQFGRWPLAYTGAGGPELAEIVAIGQRVGDGDDEMFARSFGDAGDAVAAEAERAAAGGHHRTASALYLRASALYGTALHPLYGSPVHPLLQELFARQSDAFARGLAALERPALPLTFPCDGVDLPGFLIPAQHSEAGTPRPVIIFTNGYDATMPDMYFASAVAATRRGYHAVLFDGPGQGAMLYSHGVPMRPDWEVVVSAVVDVLKRVPIVDASRIALAGWSLGGYLAPRAASGESRLAACIADPGQGSIARAMSRMLQAMGASPEQAADPASLDEEFLRSMRAAIDADRQLHWSVVQRGFWVNGVETLRDFLVASAAYTLEGREHLITCPTLITAAEGDPLAAGAGRLYDRLRCEKTLMPFTAREAAADHCEMGNRSLLNMRVLDWLDDTLAAR